MDRKQEQKTVADILAEMRDMSEKAKLSSLPFSKAIGEVLKETADRLEAAHKRELAEAEAFALEAAAFVEASRRKPAGDTAAMREALEKCANMGEQIDCQLGSSDATVYAFRHERCLAHNISECARAALSKPARNCDIGTAEEQAERFKAYCGQEVCKRASCQFHAKASFIYACAIAWAQMPYEGEAKEGGEK